MKIFLALTAAAALLPLPALTASAQVGLEIHGLYAFSFDAEFGRVDADSDDVFGGGASLVFKLGEVARLSAGADYLQNTITAANRYDVTLIPVTAALRVGLPIEDTAYIYVGGGGGWSFNSTKVNRRSISNLELDDELLYFGCAGVEFNLSRSVALRGEFRYVWHETKTRWKFTGEEDSTIDLKLDHMQARLGLTFWF